MIEKFVAWASLVACDIALALANLPDDIWAFECRPLEDVGTVNYGVYLLHNLVLHVVNRALDAAAIYAAEPLFVLDLLGTVALAGVSYRFFETPILSLKARFH